MIKFLAGMMLALVLTVIEENKTRDYKMSCSQKGKLDVCVVYHRDGFQTTFNRGVK